MRVAPDRVWQVLADIEAWPRWLPTVTAVEALSDGPVGVGSRFAVQQPRLGRSVWEVTEWRPGRGFTWVSNRPGVRTTGTHVVRAASDGAEVELGIEWSGAGSWLARLLYGGLTRRYVSAELAAISATAGAMA